MTIPDPPSFEEAAAYLVLPAHLSREEAEKMLKAVEETRPEGTPLLSVKAERDDAPAGGGVQPLALPAILAPIVILAGKEVVKGVSRVVRDSYESNQEAKESYDKSAREYNESRERWWKEKYGG